MGAALEKLGQRACEQIAESLLQFTGNSSGKRKGVRCPWHDEKTTGACWYDAEKDRGTCYSCQNSGDIIDIFAHIEGFPPGSAEAFRSFFAKFAPQAKLQAQSGARPVKPVQSWQPRADAREADNPTWVDGATQWVNSCTTQLRGEDFTQLMRWGVNPDTAASCKIGKNTSDIFVPFTQWGLPYAENAKGRERHIHLPQGFVFPVFDFSGALLRVKVRLDNPRDGDPKYKAVVGGCPSCYGIWGEKNSKIWVAVETERDAMLLWQELGMYGIGAMATGSASMPPDAVADALLRSADCVINALDNDTAGASASWGFDPTETSFRWNTAYTHSVRWMVPPSVGKDPGDLAGKIDIADWLLSALPEYLLPQCKSRLNAAPNSEYSEF